MTGRVRYNGRIMAVGLVVVLAVALGHAAGWW